MKARFGRPYFSLDNFSSGRQQTYFIRYSGLVTAKSPKMACSSSALNYSGILTEDDITAASLARLNPWSPGFFAVEPGARSVFSLEP